MRARGKRTNMLYDQACMNWYVSPSSCFWQYPKELPIGFQTLGPNIIQYPQVFRGHSFWTMVHKVCIAVTNNAWLGLTNICTDTKPDNTVAIQLQYQLRTLGTTTGTRKLSTPTSYSWVQSTTTCACRTVFSSRVGRFGRRGRSALKRSSRVDKRTGPVHRLQSGAGE